MSKLDTHKSKGGTLGVKQPTKQCKLGTDWLEGSSAEKGGCIQYQMFVLLMDSGLNMSEQCACVVGKSPHMLGWI